MTLVRRGAMVLRCAATGGKRLWPALLTGLSIMAGMHLLPALALAEATGATSNRPAREDALRAIPWRQMSPVHRRNAQRVVNNTTIYRRLPTRIIDCDPDLFTFLVQNPDVVIDVWRVMGVSQVVLDRMPNGSYRGSDGAGTTGTVGFLHADWGHNAQNLAVVYAEGAYEGPPLVVPLKAQSVILLRSGAVQESNGRHYVTVRIDSFLRLEQLGVDLVAKTVQPWIAKTADQNLIETLTFVSNFSRTAEQNPAGIERLAARLPSIDQKTRNELVALSFRTAERYASRQAGHSNPAILAHRTDVEINHR